MSSPPEDNSASMELFVVAFAKAGKTCWCQDAMRENDAYRLVTLLNQNGVPARVCKLNLHSGPIEELENNITVDFQPLKYA